MAAPANILHPLILSFAHQKEFGILCAVVQVPSNQQRFCLIRQFEKTGVANEFECPLLILSSTIISVPVDDICSPASIVHECAPSCKIVDEKTLKKTVERENIQQLCDNCSFVHDYSNSLYCFNVFCM